MLARTLLTVTLCLGAAAAFAAESKWPNYQEADFVIKDYVFNSGERLPEVKLHYRALGTAKRFGSIEPAVPAKAGTHQATARCSTSIYWRASRTAPCISA